MTPREANADLLAEITALRDRVASLTRENAELQGGLAQASHREGATSGILRVISQSPTDVQPVFDAVAGTSALTSRVRQRRSLSLDSFDHSRNASIYRTNVLRASMNDAGLWHPWLRINRVLRAMLHTRWSAEAWSVGRSPGGSAQ